MATFFCLLLAAGRGARFSVAKPKQYFILNNGKTVLETSLSTFTSVLPKAHFTLLINKNDSYFFNLELAQKFDLVYGGDLRANTVLNGLVSLEKIAKPDDWILVHDVARCLLHKDDLLNLVRRLKNDAVGGLLATPLIDTIKLANKNLIIDKTLDRTLLWAAQTPQMFRYEILSASLKSALRKKIEITDESSCVELNGYLPKIIPAKYENFKITHKNDLNLANFILSTR